MAIKTSLGNLKLASSFDKIADFISYNNIEILPIGFLHIQKLLKLDFHHRDPFDRIIIAQSITEKLIIVSKDENFPKYTSKILWR